MKKTWHEFCKQGWVEPTKYFKLNQVVYICDECGIMYFEESMINNPDAKHPFSVYLSFTYEEENNITYEEENNIDPPVGEEFPFDREPKLKNIAIDEEFISICKLIEQEDKKPEDWDGAKAGNRFRTKSFCGEYDKNKNLFFFKFYDDDNQEHWFRINLTCILNIANGNMKGLMIDIE